jgi:hypothetical protein
MASNRRDFFKLASASLGGTLVAERAARSITRDLREAPRSRKASAATASLQSFLWSSASPTFSAPLSMPSPPQITWAGPMSALPVPTSLPNGVIYPASSASFGGPIRSRFTASLVGSPAIADVPALAVSRAYTCKGAARTAGSPNIMRFSTNAAVVEIAGFVLPNTYTSQTLIVNGQLVPPQVLSVSNGSAGGWCAVGARINFGSSVMRDIWLETGIYVAYIKLGSSDTLVAATDGSNPQITVVGDNYLTYPSNTFANGGALALEIGTRLGLDKVAVDAITGSGYWNSGGDFGNLNDRVLAHAADNSNIYLVLAGLNDYGDLVAPNQVVWPTAAQYQTAVVNYFKSLRAAQPSAVIAATAPFCPNPTLSDSSYIANSGTNSSALGDFLYKSQVQLSALQQIAGPWVWIDALMGTGWVNSSGASGLATGLQWFTGGTPGTGTGSNPKPGNLTGGTGGGFGGIASIPVVSGGQYTQAPEIWAEGGSGAGLLVASTINAAGALNAVTVTAPGVNYNGELPGLTVNTAYQKSAAVLGTPVLVSGINAGGSYPPAIANNPGGYSNAYMMLMSDLTNPSPAGVDYLASRIAQSLYQAVLAL